MLTNSNCTYNPLISPSKCPALFEYNWVISTVIIGLISTLNLQVSTFKSPRHGDQEARSSAKFRARIAWLLHEVEGWGGGGGGGGWLVYSMFST